MNVSAFLNAVVQHSFSEPSSVSSGDSGDRPDQSQSGWAVFVPSSVTRQDINVTMGRTENMFSYIASSGHGVRRDMTNWHLG
jgi:hypothetical protein